MEYSVCSVWFNLVPPFFTHFSEQFSGLFWEHPWMYERLKKILSDDWDVLVVAGYRPYFEWLKSYWFQGMQHPCS